MKKILSLTLAVLMVIAMIPTAFAATAIMCFDCGKFSREAETCSYCQQDKVCTTCGKCQKCDKPIDYSNGTKVEYKAADQTAYTITVPAQLAPGASGEVKLEGTWASDATVKVTADTSVTLTNSINAADQKVLDVTFNGIEKAGSNTSAVEATEAISVSDISNALFGTWNGKFNYNVEITYGLISFTIAGTECQAERGMTWEQWLESEYYTQDITIRENASGNGGLDIVGLGYMILTSTNRVGVDKSDVIIAGNAYSYGN